MKSSAVQIVFALLALVLGAAVQDMFPPFGGVKPPLLAILSIYATLRRPFTAAIAASVSAGALADALGGVPAGCNIAFFAALACLVRAIRGAACGMPLPLAGLATAALVAPLLELWYAICGSGASGAGELQVRALIAAVPAAIAGCALFAVMPQLERISGVPEMADEAKKEAQ